VREIYTPAGRSREIESKNIVEEKGEDTNIQEKFPSWKCIHVTYSSRFLKK